MKFSLLAVVGFASLAFSAPTSLDTRQSSLQTTTDNYLFTLTISQFITNRNGKIGPAELDWTSDGCSDSPDNPFGFNCTFHPHHIVVNRFSHLSLTLYLHQHIVINSCYRHDFGYRNYKKQSRFTDANKARIDSNFKKDMFNQCTTEKYRDACEATATIYYEAVKVFGKKRAVEIREARLAAEQT
jgi:hypothetical protein